MKQMSIFDIEMRDFLNELKDSWQETIEGDGGHCPCCNRWGKINAFSLNETFAFILKWMSESPADEEGYINLGESAPRWAMRGKNYSLLKHWKLIEQHPKNDDTTKRKSGMWRLTQTGFDFVNLKIDLPLKAFVYDNEAVGFSKETVFFPNCFGKKFDYAEVMSTTFKWSMINERMK